MTKPEVHLEPFIQLADLSHDRALVAWGAFGFTRDSDGQRWRLVADADLPGLAGRRTCIGTAADPYGAATVRVRDDSGTVVAQASTSERTWVWLEGLEPDTAYTYEVIVDDEPWAAGVRRDWSPSPRGGYDLVPAGNSYDLRFRTWPDPAAPTPEVTFVAIGDFGVGTGTDSESSRRQRRVAEVLELAVRDLDARFVVSLGDTVYQRGSHSSNGDRDDDWYSAFFQPYRYAIARVPFFPAIGNHDNDTDGSDDREQMEDNFHLHQRFRDGTERASMKPGLNYRLHFGRDLELVCVDTSVDTVDEEVHRFFQDPRHRAWLDDAFNVNGARWVIPFSHHPVYCAGPSHENDEEMREAMVPLFDRAGVRLALAGHEHNFQVNRVGGRTYVISGSGGKVDDRTPVDFEGAGTTAWGAQAHLLVVHVDGSELSVTPVSGLLPDGSLHRMTALTPDDEILDPPFVVRADTPLG